MRLKATFLLPSFLPPHTEPESSCECSGRPLRLQPLHAPRLGVGIRAREPNPVMQAAGPALPELDVEGPDEVASPVRGLGHGHRLVRVLFLQVNRPERGVRSEGQGQRRVCKFRKGLGSGQRVIRLLFLQVNRPAKLFLQVNCPTKNRGQEGAWEWPPTRLHTILSSQPPYEAGGGGSRREEGEVSVSLGGGLGTRPQTHLHTLLAGQLPCEGGAEEEGQGQRCRGVRDRGVGGNRSQKGAWKWPRTRLHTLLAGQPPYKVCINGRDRVRGDETSVCKFHLLSSSSLQMHCG